MAILLSNKRECEDEIKDWSVSEEKGNFNRFHHSHEIFSWRGVHWPRSDPTLGPF